MKLFFSSLALVFWVATLPAQNNLDLIGLPSTSAQAAYGLRKLSGSYTGQAVRVRRASDKLEAIVSFDGTATPAISSSSPITIVSGVTVSATLGSAGTGEISTIASKPGTIAVVVLKTGTITATLGQTGVIGTGTQFLSELSAGDRLFKSDNTFLGVVKSITNNTALVLNNGSIANHSASAFKSQSATVSGSGTDFADAEDGFSVGDRLYKTDHTYLGTITSISGATTMTLDARDAVAYSAGNYVGTTNVITGSGTTFTSEDVGKMLISKNNIILGVINAYNSATSVTLTAKAGDATGGTGSSFKVANVPANFGDYFASTDVFVKTWYDQSGFGRDIIQPAVESNQPRIVASGIQHMVNGKPSILFASSLNSWLRTTAPATWLTGTLYTLNCVSAETSASVPASYSFALSTTGYTGPGNTISHFGYRTSNQYTVAQYGSDVNFTTQATTSLELHTAVKYSSTSSRFYKNGAYLGALSNSGASNLNDLGLFSAGYYTPIPAGYYNGSISEIVIFAEALDDTERGALDNNQMSYFGISTANWVGGISTDWNTAGNWSPATVPTATSPAIVVIPSGCTYYPNITGISAGNSIVVNQGSSLTISSGGTLQLGGSLTNFGTVNPSAGTIELIGNASQAFGLGIPAMQNLIINNSTGVTLSGSINVTGNLTFTSGYLSLGGLSLTLGGTVTNTVSGGIWGSPNATITVTGTPTLSFNQNGNYNQLKNLVINASSAVATLSNNLIMASGGTLTFTNGKLSIGSNTLTLRGAVTNTVAGGLRSNGSGNITVDGVVSPTLSIDQTTPGTTNALNNLTIATTSSNTVSIANDLLVNGTLTINSGQTLNMGTATLGGTLTTVSNNGTLNTQNVATNPLPTGKTWGGTIQYNSASSAQTAMAGTYNNLTIATTGGATASGDITVNGTLSLASNPSANKGNLEMVTNYSDYPGTTNANPGYNNMSSYYLNMGSSATTTGTGDVTGIVKRSVIVANTAYTFGNAYTTVALTAGTMPDAITVTLKIGTVPPHAETSDAVMRHFEIVPLVTNPETFTSTSRLSINFHYLDAELNGNTESKLITGDYDIEGGFSSPDEHGRAAYDFTNNYIGLSNVPISYFIKKSDHVWRTIFFLRDFMIDYKTWTGAVSTVWYAEENWNPSGYPNKGNFVVIPDVNTTNNRSPVLPDTTTINTMTIEEGGILVMGNSKISIINSLSAGWEDRSGLSDPGTSTVYFLDAGATVSGSPGFYNVVILDTAEVTVALNSTMKIKNSLIRNGAGKWYPGIYQSTVDFSKEGDQTIPLPNGSPHYSNLTLSGSGTKSLPASWLNLGKNFSLLGTVNVAPTASMRIAGDLNIGTGTTFYAGSLNDSVGGHFINDGTFDKGASSLVMNGSLAQIISGSSASEFYNLTIDNSTGVTCNSSALTTVTGTLLINSGKKLELAAGKRMTVSGSITNNGGSDGFSILSSAEGTGSLLYAESFPGSVARYIPNTLDWHFLSSPVTAQEIWPEFAPEPEDISGTYYFSQTPYNWDFYYWNPNALTSSQLYWVNLRKDASGAYNERDVDALGSEAGFGATTPPTFIAGRGYLVAYGNDWNPSTGSPEVHTFTGTINGGDKTWNVISGANSYNLAGNPYPSAIDWKADNGWSNRSNLKLNSGGYDYWIYVASAGNYGLFNSAGVSGTLGTSREIAPMQAVFVNAATTGSIGMDYNVQVHSGQPWLKDDNTEMNILRFRLSTAANNWYDEFNLEVDRLLEAGGSRKFWSMHEEAPEMWSMRDGQSFSIERKPEISDQTVIRLGVKAGIASTYTFNARGVESFPFAKSILLDDLVTGHTQELKTNPVYHFGAAPGDPQERLRIRFAGPYGTQETINLPTVMIWYADQTIFIRGLNNNISNGNVLICNLLGQVLFRQKMAGPDLRIPANLPAGCYIVSYHSEECTVNRKILIR